MFIRGARSRQADRAISFSDKLAGENKMIAQLVRKNSLFLSAAAQNNHEMLLPIYNWFLIKNLMSPEEVGSILRLDPSYSAKACAGSSKRSKNGRHHLRHFATLATSSV